MLAQRPNDEVPAVRGIADAEAGNGRGVQTAPGQVGGTRAPRRRQCGAILRMGQVVGGAQTLPHAGPALRRLWNLDPTVTGKGSRRLGEGQILDLHQKGDRVATFVTAETVEVSAIGVDVERGSLLVVKGAETLVAATRSFQGDEATDEIDQVDAVTELLDCLIGN